ncbi:hypothetical protein Efla_007297 [Eimeria flavescens]
MRQDAPAGRQQSVEVELCAAPPLHENLSKDNECDYRLLVPLFLCYPKQANKASGLHAGADRRRLAEGNGDEASHGSDGERGTPSPDFLEMCLQLGEWKPSDTQPGDPRASPIMIEQFFSGLEANCSGGDLTWASPGVSTPRAGTSQAFSASYAQLPFAEEKEGGARSSASSLGQLPTQTMAVNMHAGDYQLLSTRTSQTFPSSSPTFAAPLGTQAVGSSSVHLQSDGWQNNASTVPQQQTQQQLKPEQQLKQQQQLEQQQQLMKQQQELPLQQQQHQEQQPVVAFVAFLAHASTAAAGETGGGAVSALGYLSSASNHPSSLGASISSAGASAQLLPTKLPKHPFVRFPRLRPGVKGRQFSELFLKSPHIPIKRHASALRGMRSLLLEEELDQQKADELVELSEQLAMHGFAHMTNPVHRLRLVYAAEALGRRFVLYHGLYCASLALGQNWQGTAWWRELGERLTNEHRLATRRFSSSPSMFIARLALDLLEALSTLKNAEELADDVVIDLKRRLFCNKESPLRYRSSIWDAWRKDDETG